MNWELVRALATKKKMALRKPPHPDVVQWTFSSRRGKKISAHYARVFNRENAKKKKPAKKWDFSAVITEGVTSCHPLVSWFTSSVYKEKKKTNLSLVLLSPPTATISPSAFSIYETVNRFLLRGSFFFLSLSNSIRERFVKLSDEKAISPFSQRFDGRLNREDWNNCLNDYVYYP